MMDKALLCSECVSLFITPYMNNLIPHCIDPVACEFFRTIAFPHEKSPGYKPGASLPLKNELQSAKVTH